MKTLAIIVSYNFEKWIDRCLGSLRQQTVPVDVMVIDNNSGDRTVERIRRDYPEVILVENKSNLGFGRANNIGLHKADREGYDGVLLLNQDAWIDPDTVAKLTVASRQHPDYGILSPIHLTGDGQKIEHGFSTYTGIADPRQQFEEELMTVPFVDAAIWYLPIGALRRVGFFAPIFYHYGEDKDLENRMAYYGMKTGVVTDAFGCHDREFRRQTRRSFFRAERVYHLSEYCNVNYSFARAFALGVLAVGKKVILSMGKGRFGYALTYLSIMLGLLFRSGEVCKARELSLHVDLRNYV